MKTYKDGQVAPEVLGSCPMCKKRLVLEYEDAYGCEGLQSGRCSFIVYKKIKGKKISKTQVKKILKNGKTDLITGFVSDDGNTFAAYLAISAADRSLVFTYPPKRLPPYTGSTGRYSSKAEDNKK